MTVELQTEPIRKRTKKTVKVEPVVEPVVEVEQEPVVEVVEESVLEKLSNLRESVGELVKQLKEVDLEIKKISVVAKKQLKKKSKKSTTRGPSNHGFNAEVFISDQLADFLEVERGSKMRPPQVFSKINQYAIENDCKDPSNKSIFKCDKKLKKLLGEPVHLLRKDDESLGFGVSNFNINKYLKSHYTKVEL